MSESNIYLIHAWMNAWYILLMQEQRAKCDNSPERQLTSENTSLSKRSFKAGTIRSKTACTFSAMMIVDWI